jgi:hypothetical protein
MRISALSGDGLGDLLARLKLDGVSCTLRGGERVDANSLVELVRGGNGETTRNVRRGFEGQLVVLVRLLKKSAH